MKKKIRVKRLLAFCMMVCIVFAMMPMTARAETNIQNIYTNDAGSSFTYEVDGDCTIPFGYYVYGDTNDTYTLTDAIELLFISNVNVTMEGDGNFADYVIVGSGSIVLGNSSITPTLPANEITYADAAGDVVDAFYNIPDDYSYDLTIGDEAEFAGEYANVTIETSSQLTIPGNETLTVIDALTVNGSLSGEGILQLNGNASVNGLELYNSTGALFDELNNENDWYSFALVEDKWTLQEDGGGAPPSSGEIRLEVLEAGELGYNASDFTYTVTGGASQNFMYEIEYPMSANGNISEAGNVTVTLNKHNSDDPFWGFAYTFDEQNWYDTVEASHLREGDMYNSETNTLTIVRSGTEGIRIDAYINDPPQNNLDVVSDEITISENTEYDNVFVINATLTIDSGTTLTVYGDLILENGTMTVNGNLIVYGTLIMDSHNAAVNTVSGIAFYDNAEAGATLDNTDGVFTFDRDEAFLFDTIYNKWVRQNGGNSDDGGNGSEDTPMNYDALRAFMENDWGVAYNSNVESMKTAFIIYLWDVLSHEWNGESIYTNEEEFATNVSVDNVIAGTDTISSQSVSYHNITITIPVPDAEDITVTSKLYAIPTNYIILEHTSDKTKMLWDYTSEEALVFDDTEPDHFRCMGARISGIDKRSKVCFLQMEGGILSGYLKTVQIFNPDYQGVKFDTTEGMVAAQWGYFYHAYVDFGNTTMEKPEEISMFYGYDKLTLNCPNVVGTAGEGLTINNVSVVNGKGIPANVITYNIDDKSITFHTDYYTEVPLQVEYTLTDTTSKTAYVTIKRTGIHVSGWMRSGDKLDHSTERVLHGASQLGVEFNWGTDGYVVYATYYADGKVADGSTASMYAKLTYANGRTETKSIAGSNVSTEDAYSVDSFDFQIYKGSAENAPTSVEVIAYIVNAENTSCSSAFTGNWNKPSEQ